MSGLEPLPAEGSPHLDAGPDTDAQTAPATADATAEQPKESLLNAAARARRGQVEETEHERIIREEEDILRNITAKTALQAVGERARVSHSVTCACAPQATLCRLRAQCSVLLTGQVPCRRSGHRGTGRNLSTVFNLTYDISYHRALSIRSPSTQAGSPSSKAAR